MLPELKKKDTLLYPIASHRHPKAFAHSDLTFFELNGIASNAFLFSSPSNWYSKISFGIEPSLPCHSSLKV